MADAPKILEDDYLDEAYPKINLAIDNANEALNRLNETGEKADLAVETANQAIDKVVSVESNFNGKLAIDVTFTPNSDIVNSTGANASGTNYVSNIIPVTAGAKYYFSKVSKVAFYYQDGTFKSTGIPNGTSVILTLASDVYFIKFSASDITNFVLAKSDKAVTYEEANTQTMKIDSIPELPRTKIANLDIELGKIENNFKPKLAIDVSFTSNKDIVNTTGAITNGTGYVTDLLSVVPSNTYYFSNVTKVAYFYQSGAFKGIGIYTGSNIITMASDVYYIRFLASGTTDISTYVYAVSDKPLTYEDANATKLKEIAMPENLDEIVKEIISNPISRVSCFGDSLTAGAGGNGTTYPSVLASLSGLTVRNVGVGGESCVEITARQGALPDIVNPFTIPAETTAVEITKSGKVGLLGLSGVNPCQISGITGNLSYSNSKYYFTRTTAGLAVNVTRPVPLITNAMLNYREDMLVIFMGQNGGYSDDIPTLIRMQRKMIEFNNTGKYLILGLTTGTEASRQELENMMRLEYGRNYINLRDYIVKYGLADVNLTPTAEDEAAIAQGSVPPSLLSDTIHGNSHYYTIIGQQVYKRGKELGFWS